MSLVWLNGHLCEAEQAHVSLADRGLTLGDGLFETLRVQNGRVCHLDLHMQRLQHGGAVLGLDVPNAAMVAQAAQALLQATKVQNGSARLTVTRGVAPRGLLPPKQGEPTVFMTVTAGEAKVSSASLMTSQTIRRDEQSPLNCLKSLNYLPNILARQEAARAGCDEALLLNVGGEGGGNNHQHGGDSGGGGVFYAFGRGGGIAGSCAGRALAGGVVAGRGSLCGATEGRRWTLSD